MQSEILTPGHGSGAAFVSMIQINLPAGGHQASSYEADWDLCVIAAQPDQKQNLLYAWLVSAP